VNYIGATMTLNSSRYTISELLLLLLLQQLPIASVAHLIWSEIAETSLVAVVSPWSLCRYYTVITEAAVWVNYPKYFTHTHYNRGDRVKTRHLYVGWQHFLIFNFHKVVSQHITGVVEIYVVCT